MNSFLQASVVNRTYRSEGIVLKRTNFGEADKIITIFSKHYGKLTLLAKGIRRLSSRKRGNLEIFNKVVFLARKGKSLDLITETELLESFSFWRNDLKKVAVAYQLCEMVDKLTVEGSEQEKIYHFLIKSLKDLGGLKQENYESFLGSFGLKLLVLLGYWPQEKPVPKNFRVSVFVENIIEKELKSKKLLKKI